MEICIRGRGYAPPKVSSRTFAAGESRWWQVGCGRWPLEKLESNQRKKSRAATAKVAYCSLLSMEYALHSREQPLPGSGRMNRHSQVGIVGCRCGDGNRGHGSVAKPTYWLDHGARRMLIRGSHDSNDNGPLGSTWRLLCLEFCM